GSKGGKMVWKWGGCCGGGPPQRIGCIFRSELAVAVMALDAGSDLECPFRSSRIGSPTFRNIGLDELWGNLTWLDAHEPIEHPIQQSLVGSCRGQMRVELACIGRSHPDREDPLFGLHGARSPEQPEQNHSAWKNDPPDHGDSTSLL